LRTLSAIETTAELASEHLQANLLGGITSAQQVITSMIKRGKGSILFTGAGPSELTAIPFVTPLSIHKSGLRSYVHCLHDELAEKGVYAGMLSVADPIKEGTDNAPDKIAATYYDMYVQKDGAEVFHDGPNAR